MLKLWAVFEEALHILGCKNPLQVAENFGGGHGLLVLVFLVGFRSRDFIEVLLIDFRSPCGVVAYEVCLVLRVIGSIIAHRWAHRRRARRRRAR